MVMVSIVWQAYLTLQTLSRASVLLSGLLAIERTPPKVAIGCGACTDLQINATEYLSRRGGPQKRRRAAYYFQSGAAAELVLANDTLFKQLIEFSKVMDKEHVHCGLQMMDVFSIGPGEREKRLQQVKMQLISQLSGTRNHFEMASFVGLKLLQELRRFVLPYVDSLEQVLTHGHITLANDCNPRIVHTLDQMRQVFSHYSAESRSDPKRRHTLAYQPILTIVDSQWKNTRAAAAKATPTAHRYVCKSQLIRPESVLQVLDDSFATSMQENAPRMRISAARPVPC
ncbi:GL26242 [Drosophila persimilis]|uniref:GL26242 n=1 Tax=Drosophila persimilis TaxID=7234 RepID=B4GJ98_DROPE|nr:GL26242 [Drosophila persimilis]